MTSRTDAQTQVAKATAKMSSLRLRSEALSSTEVSAPPPETCDRPLGHAAHRHGRLCYATA
eukprot:6736112-Prymnesium_polylepis.1